MNEEGADGQGIGSRPEKDVDSLGRGTYERFAVNVEAGIEHDACAPPPAGFAQQLREDARIFVGHNLRPARSVHADDALSLIHI